MTKHSFVCISIYLLGVINDCLAHIDSEKLQEECKIADICRHDQVPICGIDSCGEMRTFIDNCDMHEFNCDSKKDFVQKPHHECWVTCKRGRSFKKPLYNGAGCDQMNLV
ncbi:uncharacterized protein LOC113238797 [Hyposmocoma kahamanoa]|uniref:uncharacterized protein LOC113238797 n=1 Tax=Hyposmocoma kahamanoa TaxID=1477025 RepID=UPI000E6D85C7|nr:uncharacterized protein LOC113238797 [Hyposmocoma kahamanoa]